MRYQDDLLLWKGSAYGATLPSNGSSRSPIVGQGENISQGGICLVTKVRLEVSQFLRMTLRLKTVPVDIPTLVEVRWIKPLSSSLFKIGARFLY
ncbi:MAG: PilZ domain-containing protein [Candidatus Manganitrophaceae bacterium]